MGDTRPRTSAQGITGTRINSCTYNLSVKYSELFNFSRHAFYIAVHESSAHAHSDHDTDIATHPNNELASHKLVIHVQYSYRKRGY